MVPTAATFFHVGFVVDAPRGPLSLLLLLQRRRYRDLRRLRTLRKQESDVVISQSLGQLERGFIGFTLCGFVDVSAIL
jgi:hypothetical protein